MQFLHIILCTYKQECIPVGCVPSAVVAIGGGYLPGGCQPRGGVCLGGCLPRGVSTWGGVYPGLCLPRVVSVQRGCPSRGGVCPSAFWIYPLIKRITDAFENITLPQLLCGR